MSIDDLNSIDEYKFHFRASERFEIANSLDNKAELLNVDNLTQVMFKNGDMFITSIYAFMS
jgi:hypothetical protein